MSILYSDEDGYFVSHERFISKLYEEILNNTENIVPFYEHFFHIHKPFFRDEQKIKTDTDNDGVKRKRKRQNVEVIFIITRLILLAMFVLIHFALVLKNIFFINLP